MVPSVPVTPEPAVSGPLTGGQKVAHWPEQFDLVEVSMANQYRVMPLESTTTCWLPMVFSVTVLPLAEAGAALLLLPPAAGVVDRVGSGGKGTARNRVGTDAGVPLCLPPSPDLDTSMIGRW